MTDREYANADREVIGMVNRGHGPGGELPSVELSFLPAARAERAQALDYRIEQVRQALPFIGIATLCLVSFLLGTGL